MVISYDQDTKKVWTCLSLEHTQLSQWMWLYDMQYHTFPGVHQIESRSCSDNTVVCHGPLTDEHHIKYGSGRILMCIK